MTQKIKTPTSPILEVISHEKFLEKLEKRKLPRLTMTNEQFRVSTVNRIFPIRDLSECSMGFWLEDSSDRELFLVGQTIEGSLNLKREKYPLKARVRYLDKNRVSCEFEDPSEQLLKVLKEFLNPLSLASELKLLPSLEKNAIWYHGPSGTDLILRRLLDGQYQSIIVYVFNFFIQWDCDLGLSTGSTFISDREIERIGVFRWETLFINPDQSPDPSKLSIAKTIILGSNVPQDLKNWCVLKIELGR